MEILLIVIVLALLGMSAILAGADSRDGADWHRASTADQPGHGASVSMSPTKSGKPV